jgi:hypothetical protein
MCGHSDASAFRKLKIERSGSFSMHPAGTGISAGTQKSFPSHATRPTFAAVGFFCPADTWNLQDSPLKSRSQTLL